MAERDVVLFKNAERRRCVLSVSMPAYRDFRLVLHSPHGRLAGTGIDLFEALVDVRRRLEPSGWRIAVHGSRRQAFASGLMRDMHGAMRVYICEPDRWPRRSDLVDIFGEAPTAEITTVVEQAAWVYAWIEARRRALPRGRDSSRES